MASKFDCEVTVTSKSVNGGTVPAVTVTTATTGDATVSPADADIDSDGGSVTFTVGCNSMGGSITFTGTGGNPAVIRTCRVKVICVPPKTEANNVKLFKGNSTTVTVTARGMKCVDGAEITATVQPGVPPKVTVEGLKADHTSTFDNKAPVVAGSAHFTVKCAAGDWGGTTQQIDFKVVKDPGNSYDKTITVTCNEPLKGCSDDAGFCLEPNDTPGCDDPVCCETVCTEEPLCCQDAWGEFCAVLAADLCIPTACGEAPDSCCTDNPTAGCSDATCCEQVCSVDPWCCDNQWDQLCANLALSLCSPEACPQPCGAPENGDCCTAKEGTVGCDDPECCSRVCDDDPYCCFTAWDEICATVAGETCVVCTGPPDCTGQTGDCCTAHDTSGCDDPDCCAAVCAEDSYCCEVEWDDLCAEEAATLCPACAEAIPTVSEWGLMVMTVLMFTVATVVIGRRRRAAAA